MFTTAACKIIKPTFTINQISVRQKTVACKAMVACGCDHVQAFNNVILPKTADSSVFVWLLSERGGGGGRGGWLCCQRLTDNKDEAKKRNKERKKKFAPRCASVRSWWGRTWRTSPLAARQRRPTLAQPSSTAEACLVRAGFVSTIQGLGHTPLKRTLCRGTPTSSSSH